MVMNIPPQQNMTGKIDTKTVKNTKGIEVIAQKLKEEMSKKPPQVKSTNNETEKIKLTKKQSKPVINNYEKPAAPAKPKPLLTQWGRQLSAAFDSRRSSMELFPSPAYVDFKMEKTFSDVNGKTESATPLKVGIGTELYEWRNGKKPILNVDGSFGLSFGDKDFAKKQEGFHDEEAFNHNLAAYGELDVKTGSLLKSGEFGFSLRDNIKARYIQAYEENQVKINNLVGPQVEWKPNTSNSLSVLTGINLNGNITGLAEYKGEITRGLQISVSAESDGTAKNTVLQTGLRATPSAFGRRRR